MNREGKKKIMKDYTNQYELAEIVGILYKVGYTGIYEEDAERRYAEFSEAVYSAGWMLPSPAVLKEFEDWAMEKLSNPVDSCRGIYLIYRDSMDDGCEIAGYISGTSEDADRYCDEHNKNRRYAWEREYTWQRLVDLQEPRKDQE